MPEVVAIWKVTSMEPRKSRVAERDQHEGAFAPDGVGDPSGKKRPEQLPEHHRGGNNGGHESGELEGGDEEEERARDGAKVVAVDQADDRGRDRDEDVEPRYGPPTRCPFFH